MRCQRAERALCCSNYPDWTAPYAEGNSNCRCAPVRPRSHRAAVFARVGVAATLVVIEDDDVTFRRKWRTKKATLKAKDARAARFYRPDRDSAAVARCTISAQWARFFFN